MPVSRRGPARRSCLGRASFAVGWNREQRHEGNGHEAVRAVEPERTAGVEDRREALEVVALPAVAGGELDLAAGDRLVERWHEEHLAVEKQREVLADVIGRV